VNPFDGELSAVRLSRKIFTPEGSLDKSLRLSFQSRLAADDIKVTVFDTSGRKIASLPVQGAQPDYWAEWDGRNGGAVLAPGIYIYEIKAGGTARRGAVVLAR
jgi:aminopeptidase N